ncbi:MAG: radical SAM protein [Planctomycetota bacterium]
MGEMSPGACDSRNGPPAHTTACRVNKRYQDERARAGNPNKSPHRPDDGHITSAEYAEQARSLPLEAGGLFLISAPCAGPFDPGVSAGSSGDERSPVRGGDGDGNAPGQDSGVRRASTSPPAVDLTCRHPLESWLDRRPVRWLLRQLAHRRAGRNGRGGRTVIESMLASYANPHASVRDRLLYWPLHKLIDRLRGSTSAATVRQRVCEHTATVRGLVATVRSVGEFGLTVPQRFSAPLFAVWNFTNRCNLACKHCYQDSGRHALANELTLAEKLDLVDQLGDEYVPMMAFAGGEPTVSPDLLPVLRHCRQHGMHTSVATNGTTMTPRLAAELAEAGARYIEISLDSVHAEKHDAFRGHPGMWERTVSGMRTVVQTSGLRLGIAMCVHQGNFAEVEQMLQFAVDIGASCIAHFNFIPVGRGLEMTDADLTPRQREWLLQTFNKWMQSGKIGVISTAPQLGRISLVHSRPDGRQSCSHAGSGPGWKARVVAKYLGGCGAGRTYVCIEPTGDITPCVYMPHRVLGNIRERRFRAIFRENPFWDLLCDRTQLTHHCEVCKFRSYCGGCRARADSYFGAVNAGDPGCLFNEKHWEALVRSGAAAVQTRDAAGIVPAVRMYDGTVTRVPARSGV